MTFTTKTYEQNTIYAQICSFESKGGVTEYHIMFSVTDPSLSFGEQLDSLQRAYDAVTKCRSRFPSLLSERCGQPGGYVDGTGM